MASENTRKAAATLPRFREIKRRRKVYEEVMNNIRQEILSGRLSLNQRLPTETELAKQFGVSRVAIREAVQALELAGLVAVKKGAKGGIFVAQEFERPIEDSLVNLLQGGEATLEELFEVRVVVESYAVAQATRLATPEQCEQLRNLMAEAEEEGDKGTNIRAYNLRFHRLILRMAGNKVLSILGETVLSTLAKQIGGLLSPPTSMEVLAKHKVIVDAICRRDAEEASRLVAQDITDLGKTFKRLQGKERSSDE